MPDKEHSGGFTAGSQIVQALLDQIVCREVGPHRLDYIGAAIGRV